MADNNLGNEWKDTVYNLGGAFFDLGRTLLHSVKKGVDIAYDFINDEDVKKKQSGTRKKTSGSAGTAGKASSDPIIINAEPQETAEDEFVVSEDVEAEAEDIEAEAEETEDAAEEAAETEDASEKAAEAECASADTAEK